MRVVSGSQTIIRLNVTRNLELIVIISFHFDRAPRYKSF